MDAVTLGIAKKYVDDTAKGLGAVKGAPCTIKSITEGENGSTIVFSWTGADGTEQTGTTFLPRGPQGDPGKSAYSVAVENGFDGTEEEWLKSLKGEPVENGSGVDTEARAQIAELHEEIGKTVKTINGIEPDLYGNINISSVNAGFEPPDLTWENGSIDGTSGAVYPSTTRIRTDFIDVSDLISVTIVCADGYKCAIHCFDGDKNPINRDFNTDAELLAMQWVPGTRTVRFPNKDNLHFVRFLISNSDDGTIVPEEASNVTFAWVGAGGDENFVPNGYYDQQIKSFSHLFASTDGFVDSFLFFTDPHLCGSSDVTGNFEQYLDQIAAVYNNTPTSMCVCGGDWLNNGNTKENAAFLLGKIDGAMKKRFDEYVLIVGNHDTNYQGKEYMDSGADGTHDRDALELCRLSIPAVRNLWHRKQGASYFKVNCDSAVYYIFDTQLDWYPEMDAYKWEQIDWYANSLLTNKPERSAIMMHIADANGVATPFVDAVTQIANAYNSKTSISINGKTYDFSGANGTVGFVLGGHKHSDLTYTANSIPVILTTNLQVASGYPSFDLVMVDWAEGKVNLVRAGSGESRTVTMA